MQLGITHSLPLSVHVALQNSFQKLISPLTSAYFSTLYFSLPDFFIIFIFYTWHMCVQVCTKEKIEEDIHEFKRRYQAATIWLGFLLVCW
jgi:ABC-type arginine transport system permease subunit